MTSSKWTGVVLGFVGWGGGVGVCMGCMGGSVDRYGVESMMAHLLDTPYRTSTHQTPHTKGATPRRWTAWWRSSRRPCTTRGRVGGYDISIYLGVCVYIHIRIYMCVCVCIHMDTYICVFIHVHWAV